MNLAQAREGLAIADEGMRGVQGTLAALAVAAEALADALDAAAFTEAGGDVEVGRQTARRLAEHLRDRAGDATPPPAWILPERLRAGPYGPAEALDVLEGLARFLALTQDVAADLLSRVERLYAGLRAERAAGRHAREVGHLLPQAREALRRSRRLAGPMS